MSDEELRRLERLAKTGDQDAIKRYIELRIRMGMQSCGEPIIGRKIRIGGREGWHLVTELGTLWRKGVKTGWVEAVEWGRFYQLTEPVAWIHVRLDKRHGRYKYATAYFDETTRCLMHGAVWLD